MAVVKRSSFIPRETGQEAIRKATSLDDNGSSENSDFLSGKG